MLKGFWNARMLTRLVKFIKKCYDFSSWFIQHFTLQTWTFSYQQCMELMFNQRIEEHIDKLSNI